MMFKNFDLQNLLDLCNFFILFLKLFFILNEFVDEIVKFCFNYFFKGLVIGCMQEIE